MVRDPLAPLLTRLAPVTRLLAATTPLNAVAERARAVASLTAGDEPDEPDWQYPRLPELDAIHRDIESARGLLDESPLSDLHAARLDETELDAQLLARMPSRKRVLPLAARRHGTPETRLSTGQTVRESASGWLTTPARSQPATIACERAAAILADAARVAGLTIEVRLEPSLAALAAAGDRVLYLSARAYRPNQVARLAAHEILGHLTSAFNGRAQSLRLFEHGTAASHEDQEGLCLWLERASGAFDAERRNTLALRIEAAHLLHSGATFGEACVDLRRRVPTDEEDTVRAVERCYRGGGAAARDVGYLVGLDRVDRLVAEHGDSAIRWLRAGRLSVEVARDSGALTSAGYLRAPILEPQTDRTLSHVRAALAAS